MTWSLIYNHITCKNRFGVIHGSSWLYQKEVSALQNSKRSPPFLGQTQTGDPSLLWKSPGCRETLGRRMKLFSDLVNLWYSLWLPAKRYCRKGKSFPLRMNGWTKLLNFSLLITSLSADFLISGTAVI